MSAFTKWLKIIRPFTLPASLSPVIVGLYAASLHGGLSLLPAAITILCALCLQVLSNLINDYCDFRRGSDGADRLGPPRAVSLGIITPEQLKHAIYITAVLTVATGAYLIFVGGWPIIAIGVSAMLFAWLYSATSHSLSHLGIADLFCLSYYGFIASMGTAYIQTGEWLPIAFWLGLACGAVATGILTVNNIRDVKQDEAAGKRTIIVRLGTTFGKCYYLSCLLVVPLVGYFALHSVAVFTVMLFLCGLLFSSFRAAKGREYNKILMLTGFYNLAFALMVCICGGEGKAHDNGRSIVILFENDVHCNVDGYAQLAGLRDAVQDTAWTAVVSCGDYLQGGTTGAISKGQYIADIMKEVGYTAVTLGNHEFDYKMPRMFELIEHAGLPVVSANLCEIATGGLVFAPYIIKPAGRKKVAFIGATTPTTVQTESYAFFDGSETQKYDLITLDFFGMMQKTVDAARRQGADYVIVLSHLGEEPNETGIDSRALIARTHGIDAVLDAHSHNVIPGEWVENSEGVRVLTAQTGTKFANIGKLIITPAGNLSVELIPVEGIAQRSGRVQHVVDSIKTLCDAQVGRIVCNSDVDLRILDEKGYQLVRRQETNAGDIVTDAYRIMTGAQIAVTNGGGIRTEVKKGELTYGDVVSLLPYDNQLCVIEITGAKIMELLEVNCAFLPLEDGQFPQVSGLKYTAVVADHSIRNVQVMTPDGSYEPLDPQRIYSVATIDYCVSMGGMRNVLKDAKVVRDGIMLYYDALVEYVQTHLHGHIGPEYAHPQGRITIVQ